MYIAHIIHSFSFYLLLVRVCVPFGDRLSSRLVLQAVSYSREQVVEMMEFLIEYGPLRLYWEPAEVFHKLSCVQLLLQLISIACDWRTYYGRY